MIGKAARIGEFFLAVFVLAVGVRKFETADAGWAFAWAGILLVAMGVLLLRIWTTGLRIAYGHRLHGALLVFQHVMKRPPTEEEFVKLSAMVQFGAPQPQDEHADQ